jgi:hypothetical protein
LGATGDTGREPEQRRIVCSGCFQIFPEPLIHVIPLFNDDVKEYVTTCRCETCWLPSLDETRTRIENTEGAEIASLAEFFERHGVFLHEFRRGDPLPAVRALLERTIKLVRLGAIRLSVGPLQPEIDAEALIREIKENERQAEAAYDAMYDARPAAAKDCFEDALGFFAKAIALAGRAGLDDEAARLTARSEHIVKVYNSQFRNIW